MENIITIDLIMLGAVKQCQDILAKWILPDSKISDADCLNELLEVLDKRSFVVYMRELESSIIKTDMEKTIADIERAEEEQRNKS